MDIGPTEILEKKCECNINLTNLYTQIYGYVQKSHFLNIILGVHFLALIEFEISHVLCKF